MSLFLPYNQYREECYIGGQAISPIYLMKSIFPNLIPDFSVNRVLDLGTGLGDFVRYALEERFDAYGVDIRDLFVGDRTRFRQADITERIPFEDGFFDLVFEHLFFDDLIGLQKLPTDEVRKAVNETHRVLRDNGYLYTYVTLVDDRIFNSKFREIPLDKRSLDLRGGMGNLYLRI